MALKNRYWRDPSCHEIGDWFEDGPAYGELMRRALASRRSMTVFSIDVPV